jgi:hypothetical protein
MRDITTFETAPDFPSKVRNPMLASPTGITTGHPRSHSSSLPYLLSSRFVSSPFSVPFCLYLSHIIGKVTLLHAGTVDFNLDRLLPQGDSQFNYGRTVPIHAYYFWQRLTNLPFVAVLTYAEQDLVDYDYDLHLTSNETLYFLGFKDLPSKYIDLSKLSLITASDNVSQFALDFYSHQSGPTSLSVTGASFANATFFVELHRYLNELNDPGNPASNPGVYRYVKSEGMVQKKQEPYWKAAWAQYATQFGLQLLYVGTPTSIFGQYPAPITSTILW